MASKFSALINDYTADKVNDAALSVFDEMSPVVTAETPMGLRPSLQPSSPA